MAFDIIKNDSRLERGIFEPFRGRYIPKKILNKFSRSKTSSSFGKTDSDFLEVSIYDQDRLLLFNQKYRSFDLISDKEVTFDIGTHVSDANLSDGSNYIIQYNFLRSVLGNLDDQVDFFVQDISEDRTEVKIFPVLIGNSSVDSKSTERFTSFFRNSFNSYTSNQESSAFKFVINFGNNVYYHIINWSVQRNEDDKINSVIFKLFNPIRSQVSVGDEFNIHEELSNPYFDRFSYKTFPEKPSGNVLSSPNFNVDTNISHDEGNAGFQTWDSLLETENEKVSTQKLINKFINKDEEKVDLNVNFNEFENFAHFSSVEERLKNFKYKLELIKEYQNKIENEQLKLNDSVKNDNYSKKIIEENKTKISEIINSFDDYENWLFEADSEKYQNTYPKKKGTLSSNSDEWFGEKLVDLNSERAQRWFERMVEIAKEYDSKNNDRLVNNIPVYIKEDSENESFVIFMEMIGHFFDMMWIYIKHMEYLTDRTENINELESLSKDLSQYVAKSFGQELYSGFENHELLEYGFNASEKEESVEYVFSPLSDLDENNNEDDVEIYGNDVIFETGEDDKPDGLNKFFESEEDVENSFWRRFLNSIPYLTKTKGTRRSISALLSTYGIPKSSLSIKEYGGEKLSQKETLYEFNDETHSLNIVGSDLSTNLLGNTMSTESEYIRVPWGETSDVTIGKTNWSSYMMIHDDKANSLELRFKTEYLPNDDLALFEIKDTILVSVEENPDLDKPYGIVKVYIKEQDDSNAQEILELGNLDPNSFPDHIDLQDILDSPEDYVNEKWGPLQVFDNDWYNFRLNINPDIAEIEVNIQKSSRFGNIMVEKGAVLTENNIANLKTSENTDFPIFSLDLDEFGLVESIVEADYLYIGGYPETSFSSKKGFVGEIDNLKYWKNPISKKKYDEHTKGPAKCDWDNEGLIKEENKTDLYNSNITINRNLLLNLDFTNVKDISNDTTIKNKSPNKSFVGDEDVIAKNFTSSSEYPYQFNRYSRKNFVLSMRVGPNSPQNDKIRLENNDLIGESLSSERRNELGENDGKITDSNKLGVFFSPQNEIDENIMLSVGIENLNGFLGDPRDNNKNRYKALDGINRKYWLKYNKPYNLNEYFRYARQFNKSFFKKLRELVPAKSDLRDGLLVKPHLLERDKTEGVQSSWEKRDKHTEIDLDTENLVENSSIKDSGEDDVDVLKNLDVKSNDSFFETVKSLKLTVDKRYAGNLDSSTDFETKSKYTLEELYENFDRNTYESFGTEEEQQEYLDTLKPNCDLKYIYRRVPFSDLNIKFVNPINDPDDYFHNNYIFFFGNTNVYGDPSVSDENQEQFVGIYDECSFYSGGETEISNEKFITDAAGETIRKPKFPYTRNRHYIYNREFYTAAKRMKYEGVVSDENTSITDKGPVNIELTSPDRIIASPSDRDKSGPILEIE